jgi:hypothetical protein
MDPKIMSKVLYRYEIEYSNPDDPETSIRLREIPVIRETEKCYFVKRFYWGSERRVSKDAHDTYAYDSKESAKRHFVRRTCKRISWYEYWIKECEKGLELIEKEII